MSRLHFWFTLYRSLCVQYVLMFKLLADTDVSVDAVVM